MGTGQGDPLDAVTEGLFTVWAAQSVLELVAWMCSYNQLHPEDPVSFWGFDIQQPWHDSRLLLDFIEQSVTSVAGLTDGLERCNGYGYTDSVEYYQDPDSRVVTQADHSACQEALDGIENFFDEHQDELEQTTSAEALA